MNTDVENLDREALSTLSALVRMERTASIRVLELEAQLSTAKDALRKITDEDLPTAMAEVGLTYFECEDGSTIELKPFVNATIREENVPAAHAWLREHELGDVIKNVVAVAFGKGEDEDAVRLANYLRESQRPYTQKESVHPMTLKALARERLESDAGEPLPADLFGIHTFTRAIVKRSK